MQFPILACGIKYITLLIVTSNLNRWVPTEYKYVPKRALLCINGETDFVFCFCLFVFNNEANNSYFSDLWFELVQNNFEYVIHPEVLLFRWWDVRIEDLAR